MSNLSDLLPSGAGGKSFDFVASGTLANGQTVALRSDGKVEAISSVASNVGSITQFSGNYDLTRSTYDSTANKVVVSYRDNSNDYGYSVVGTISGTSVTFGTPVVFESAGINESIPVYDASNNKTVIVWRRKVGSDLGYAIVGTVSGTSISYGSSSIFNGSYTNFVTAVYEPNSQKVVIAYSDVGNNNYGTAIVATVSGTSVSFGSEYVFLSSALNDSSDSCVNTTDNTVNIIYRDGGASNTMKMSIATVSGTALTFGNPITVSGTSSNHCAIDYNATNNKVVVAYQDGGNSNYGTARVGTSDGSRSMTFGTLSTFTAQTVDNVRAVFNQTSNNVAIIYRNNATAPYGSFSSVGTLSGTDISFADRVEIFGTNNIGFGPVYDPTANKVFISSAQGSSYFQAVVYTTSSTTASSFIGITNAAISSGATGEVAVKGGLSTTATAQTLPPVLGAQSTISSNAYYVTSAYDSTTKNTVFQFYDASNSGYGTARVASISGTTITYGTPVVYDSTGNGTWGYVAYDSNANKIVIVYRVGSKPYAVVGTVSGTSISFGTPVAISSASAAPQGIIFDSTSNKVVIAYVESGAGKAVVGTVSGTSISFGSIVQFAANTNEFEVALAYDSTNNKTVVVYANAASGNNPTAIVGTVSGTSISFGSAVVINGSADVTYISVAFDPSSGKVVVAYDQGSQSYVGTVSGTSISFGSVVSYNGGTAATWNYLTVDTATNDVVLFYNNANTNGKYVYGKVSGTSISWSTSAVVTSVSPSYGGISFNVDSKLSMMGYRQDSPQGGFVSPLSLSTVSEPFTIGSNYFVQDGGTLATTSSSNKAGKAISATALNLVDPT